MKRVGGLLALALLTTGAPAAAVAPLQPSGPWVVEGQDNMCALLRPYGDGQAQVTFGFRLSPIGNLADVIWFSRSRNREDERGKASLRLEPSGRDFSSSYTGYSLATGNTRLTSFAVREPLLPELQEATGAAVTFDDEEPVKVVLKGTARAVATLATCQKLLLQSLGIDPEFGSKMAAPPVALAAITSWLSGDDYPSVAIIGEGQGDVSVLMTVGVDGRVSQCVPFGRSGDRELDKAACRAFVRHARFKPAVGKDGQPMVSHLTQRVRWLLP